MSCGDAEKGAAGPAQVAPVPVTQDALLNGRVRLRQAAEGYRAAVDPVLLAAAVPVREKPQRVLDLGCGPGAALLCYLTRADADHGFGLEADPVAAGLCRENIEANRLANRAGVVEGDLRDLGSLVETGGFDQVFANPPYLDPRAADRPPHAGRDRAHVEGGAALTDWLDAMLLALRPKGGLTMIHRADRLPEIIAGLQGRAGDLTVVPLWPRAGVAAKRVIVKARKGVRGGAILHPGLVLHGAGQAYTAAADAILRDGAALR